MYSSVRITWQIIHLQNGKFHFTYICCQMVVCSYNLVHQNYPKIFEQYLLPSCRAWQKRPLEGPWLRDVSSHPVNSVTQLEEQYRKLTSNLHLKVSV